MVKKYLLVPLVQKLFFVSIVLILIVLTSNEAYSQRYAFRLKDNSEVFGYNPYLDTTKMMVVLESPDGEIIRFPYSMIYEDQRGLFINIYEHTRKAPYRLSILPIDIDTCRLTSFYFLELKGVGMYADSIYIGGEGSIGFRMGNFVLGVGVGYWKVGSAARIPLYLNVRYDLYYDCFRFFVNPHAGVIFDDYKVKPAIKYIKEPGPKMFGLGFGFDVPLSKYVDFSIDGGMRYIVLPNELAAPSCDPVTKVYRMGYTEYYMGYLRVGISF